MACDFQDHELGMGVKDFHQYGFFPKHLDTPGEAYCFNSNPFIKADFIADVISVIACCYLRFQKANHNRFMVSKVLFEGAVKRL